MNRRVKLNDPNKSIFVMADMHIGHKKEFIWQSRGFDSVGDHRKFIIESVNAEIGENDTLIYIGDSALNSTLDQNVAFWREIDCENVYYIWGNHESNMIQLYNGALRSQYPEITGKVEIYPLRWENIVFVGNYLEINVKKQMAVCSHYPYLSWNGIGWPSWNLCGHEHGQLPGINHGDEGLKILDCGVDNALKFCTKPFFKWEEITDIMDSKGTQENGHHIAGVK